jgi:lipid-A-disaccharide synthase
MAEIANRIAVLLPFEESIYRDAGMPCEFVGHPVLDEINLLPNDRDELKKRLGLDPGRKYLALLPGSRRHELKKLLPVLRGVVKRFKREFEDYGFVMPIAPNIDTTSFNSEFGEFEREGVVILKESAISAMACSEAAVVASGTAALQAAFVGTPLVVIYKVFPLTYLIGRTFVLKVKYISLVNILLDRPVIQELLQSRANPDAIMEELRRMLLDKDYRERMFQGFEDVKGLFEGMRPSMRVAEIVGEMAGWES